MKLAFLRSLHARLILVVALTAVPLLAFMVYGGEAIYRRRVAELERRPLGWSHLGAIRQEPILEGARQALITLAGLQCWRSAPESPECHNQLVQLEDKYLVYHNLAVVNASGRVFCVAKPPATPLDVSKHPMFLAAAQTNDLLISGLTQSAVNGEPIVLFVYPVHPADGALEAVMAAAVSTGEFARALQELPLMPGAWAALVDRDGQIIAQQPPTETLPATLVAEARRHIGDTFTIGQNEAAVVCGAELVAHTRGDWMVVAGVPRTMLLAELRQRVGRGLVLLVTVVLLVGLLTRVFSHRSILGPFRKLVRRGQGAGVGYGGELEGLIRSFDELATTLHALAVRLQGIREEESTRISRELHDQVGQALSGLRLDLSYLDMQLSKFAQDSSAAGLRDMSVNMASQIDTAIASVRRLSAELRPGVLDELGLVSAVEWQAQEFQRRARITCRMEATEGIPELDRDRSTALFRILQEALTNVARHARAKNVLVQLRAVDGRVVLTVKDDGVGIPAEKVRASQSLGLLGMRERAAAVGGTVEFAGTTVTVSVPVKSDRG